MKPSSAGADPATAAVTPDQPIGAGERIVTLDFVRGIAVLAILFPNIVAYANPTMAYFWPKALPGGAEPFDEWVWLGQLVLIDGKFRGLFTLLFGAGMMVFAERVWARDGTLWLQGRRLAWLALFGLAHFFLLWTGDILFMYAIAGFAALAMLEWQAKTQLRFGIVWYLTGALLLSILLAGEVNFASHAQASASVPAGTLLDIAKETVAMSGGSYADVVAYRLREEGDRLAAALFVAIVETIPLMLIGMGLYRMGLFQGGFDRAAMRRWGWIGLVGGAVLTLPLGLLAMRADYPFMLTQFVFSGPAAFLHLPMILGLAALLCLWAPGASATWLGRRLVATGRMAFSNYIGASAVMMLIFQGWAGGLYGQHHRDGLLPAVLLGWGLMLAWSKPWLDRFRYGPLEWLWRCLTYGKLFPLRR